MENGQLVSDATVYKFKPSEQHVVLSELQNIHNIEPHGLPSQVLSNLTASTLLNRPNQKEVEDMLSTLISESYFTKPELVRSVDLLKENPKDLLNIENIFKNFENIGINDIVKMINNPELSHMHDRIYQHVARINKKIEEAVSAEGEHTPGDSQQYMDYVKEFQSKAERLTTIGAKIG